MASRSATVHTTTAVDGLEGTFASDRLRRMEQAGQRVGMVALTALVAAGLAGVFGDAATVARAASVYLFLLAVFRISGRRTLAQVTTFDLILVLILGDATQDALLGAGATFADAVLAVSTLVILDIALAGAKRRWPSVDVLIDGLPLPLVVHGRRRETQMAAEGVTLDDLLTAARERQGLSRLDQVAFAVLEQDGRISIVPRSGVEAPPAGAAGSQGTDAKGEHRTTHG
jgi:uncharacterized membrane protein YcaP (DUF421 family)